MRRKPALGRSDPRACRMTRPGYSGRMRGVFCNVMIMPSFRPMMILGAEFGEKLTYR